METFTIIVFLIIAFVGLAMLFWGLWQQFLSKKKGAVRKIVCSIFLFAATITGINFYWAITDDSLSGIDITKVVTFGSITAALLVVAFLFMLSMYIPWRRAENEKIKREEAAQAESARIRQVEKFYEECLVAGIDTLQSESKRQKACLIAQKYYKKFDIDALIEEGKSLREKKEAKDAAAARKATKDSDRDAQKALVKYAHLHGRDKYLCALNDELIECTAELAKLQAKIDEPLKNVDSLTQKEKSWGLAGGIAQGLAGPAAGVAAAINTQNENAKIQQQNREMIHLAAELRFHLQMTYGPQISRLKSKQEELEKIYEEGRTLLIEEKGADTYFRYLKFSPEDVVISEMGTATITTTVSSESFDILGDTPAVVDGSVVAHIWDDDKEIGQAVMVLPLTGTMRSSKLTGMALFCCNPKKKYRVTFTPKDLWGMEKPRLQKN